MALTFTIGGVDKTSLVRVGSLKVTDKLNGRNTASFELISEAGDYRPEVGAGVIVTRGATRIFAGYVHEYDEDDLEGNQEALGFVIPCVDFNAIADQRRVAQAYETPGQTLSDVVNHLVTNFLDGEGITTANVQTGPVIEKAIWNYHRVSEAFNDLADLTGYIWYIDYFKDLHFVARDTNAAPFALADDSGNFRKMKVRRTRELYRNRQIIRAGVDLTDPRTETFVGDGQTRVWPLQYPIGKVPSAISVGGVPKTLGIKGVDTGKDFYWNKGEALITQDDGATKLTSAQVGSITYQGEYPLMLMAQDDAQVTSRQAIEGGSGLHEHLEDFPNVNSREQAEQGAAGLLAKFGRIPEIVTFETDDDGLAAGQIIPITNTLHGLSGSYLIETVDFSDPYRTGDRFRYKVKALDGSALGGWEEFFRALARMGRRFVVRENEVVTYLRTGNQAVTCSDTLTTPAAAATEAVVCSDALSSSSFTPESRVNRARVNRSEVA